MEYFPDISIFLLLKVYYQRVYSTMTLDFSRPLLLCTDVQTNMILLHYKMKTTFSTSKDQQQCIGLLYMFVPDWRCCSANMCDLQHLWLGCRKEVAGVRTPRFALAPASALSTVQSVTARYPLAPAHAVAPLHPDALYFFSQLPKGW